MSKGLRRTIYTLSIATGLYSLLGFLILPGIAQRIVNQQLAEHALVPAQIERIELNPFSLELSVYGLRIGEAEQAQVAFRKLAANLQLDSIWGPLHLSQVELDGLRLQVHFAKDGILNLSQLFRVSEAAPEPEPEEPKKPFAFVLDQLLISDGAVDFQDLRPEQPINFQTSDLNFELQNLSTLPEHTANMRLHANLPDSGELNWSGNLSLNPVQSQGELQLTGAQLQPWWPYAQEHLPLALQSGNLDILARYQLDLTEYTQFLLNDSSIKLSNVAINASTAEQAPKAQLGSLEVQQLALNLLEREVNIGHIHSQGLHTSATRLADGQLDWQKLFADYARTQAQKAKADSDKTEAADKAPAQAEVLSKTDDAKTAEEPPAATPAATEKAWRIRLAEGQLRDYRLQLSDRAPKEKVELLVGPLDLTIKDFDSLGQTPFELELDTGLGSKGKINVSGPVTLSPVQATLKINTQDIDLRVAQAYLRPFIRLDVESGMFHSQLQLAVELKDELKLSAEGDVQVTQLHTKDSLKKRDFLRLPRLSVEGLAYRHGQGLNINKVDVAQPYLRFVINEDRSTNVSELIVPQPASSNSPAQKAEQAPMAIRIGGINIHNGSGHFADFSLQPSFATALQELNGAIGTIDNQSHKAAGVDIKGSVDRYAPVSIKGELTPFDPLNKLDIATSFKRVELTTLTPYSGKFAGYRIRKGRLNLDLHYKINQGELQATNHLILEQLQLGEQVDSPDAVDLPVRLAVALLKDSQGNINIELPIHGNLNDPQFSVMPIVWQTLRNLIVRAVQAPFKLLGDLAGGGDTDLSQVLFPAASSELNEQAQKNLDTLANALQERPSLRLEIEGTSSFNIDGQGLALQRLEREYQSSQYRILQRRGEKVPASPDQLEVSDSDKAALLEGIYRSRLNSQPPAQWAELSRDERHANLQNAMLEHWGKNEALGRRLAQARAAAIKAYLVDNSGLDSERIYLLDVQTVTGDADGMTASLLHLNGE